MERRWTPYTPPSPREHAPNIYYITQFGFVFDPEGICFFYKLLLILFYFLKTKKYLTNSLLLHNKRITGYAIV